MAKEVPDDVAFSILSKLPLKSLKRFTCVRKSWDLLFENSYFMNMFRNNFISKIHSYYQDTSLLLLQSDPTHSASFVMYLLSGKRFQNRVKLDWPPPIQDGFERVSILGSGIHGILCLYETDTNIILWNLATQEFKIIPPSPIESLSYLDFSINLHGFGYDHVRDDYKMIRHVFFFSLVANFEGDCPYPFWEIYSVRSRSWRKLDIDHHFSIFGLQGYDIYMNGVSHWLLRSYAYNAEPYLVSFDFSSEILFTTTLPLDLCDKYLCKLAVLNGSVAVISKSSETTTTFHISILGELGVKDSWTKLFIVGPLSCVEHPIGTGKNGDIFFKKNDEELAWFDLSTMMIEEIGVKCISKIVIYKENLLPIEPHAVYEQDY